MAEGMLGGILGEEDEKPEVESPEALASAEAFASAVAAKLTGNDPGVARKTEEFLTDQSALLKVQKNHLEEEHGLRMVHLRNQLAEEGVRRFGLRLRVGFQLFLVLVSTAISVGLLMLFYEATRSRNVIIHSFDIAPGLATTSPGGKIVAASLLDRLTQLQAATRISAEKRGLSNAWTNEISVELPEVGLSIGQIERALKARFGHDEHIDGDLVSSDIAGLAMTVRGNHVLPKTFVDNESHLQKLVDQAAEYIYGESEPGLFAKYLSDSNRASDAIAFSKAHLASARPRDQPLLLNYWGNAILASGGPNTNSEALPLFREAVRIDPDYWAGYYNLALTQFNLGDVEGAIGVGRQMIERAGGRPGKAPEDMYTVYDSLVFNLQAERAGNLADMATSGGTLTSQSGSEGLNVALVDAQLHDIDAARLRLKTTLWNEKASSDIAGVSNTEALIAEEVGDLKEAVSAWDRYAIAFHDPYVSSQNISGLCLAAISYERTGQSDKAEAALTSAGAIITQTVFGRKRMYSNIAEIGPVHRIGTQSRSDSHPAILRATTRGELRSQNIKT